MKGTLIELKINLQGNNNRADEAENQINDLEHKAKTNNQNKKKREYQKNEDRVRSLWNNFNRTNIQIIGVPEGEEKDQEIENFFEKIMKETPPNLVKEIDNNSRKP